MDLSLDLAKNRLDALKKCFESANPILLTDIPLPHKPWKISPEDLHFNLRTKFQQPNHCYIEVKVSHNGEVDTCLFNIRRFGEINKESRIDIYHDGDNSTLQRAGTYGISNGRQLTSDILQHFPQLKASNYPGYELLGSLPHFGPISREDFEKNLRPGLGMHALARWAFFHS